MPIQDNTSTGNKAATLATIGLSAAGLGSQLFNTSQTAKQNQKNREFAENQANVAWGRQLDMWNRTNEYNSPAEQMARFQQAGLNPHLIYGKGTPGNASQSGTPQQAKWAGQALKFDMPQIMTYLNTMTDIKQKNAQTDNLKEMRLNLQKDRNLKDLEIGLKGIDLKWAPYLTAQQGEMNRYGIMKRSQEIEKLINETTRISQTHQYEKWKYAFIQQYGYTPDAPPSQWKFLYDMGRFIKKLKNKKPNLPSEWKLPEFKNPFKK